MIFSDASSKKTLQYILVAALGSMLLFINWPFLTPLLIAGIFALGLVDFVERASQRLKLSRPAAVWILILAGLLLFWLPLAVATYRIFVHITEQQQQSDSSQWMQKTVHLKSWLLSQISTISDFIGFDVASPARALIDKAISKFGELILAISTGFFQQLPNLFVSSIVFTLSLVFFLMKSSEIRLFIFRNTFLTEQKTAASIEALKKSCSTTLFSTIVIGLIQALIIGIGSLIFKQGDFWLVVIITFFVSFIPVIGAAPLGYVLAILAYLEGSYGAAMGLAVVATIAGTIDNILKPFMVSSFVKSPAIIAFTSVLGAVLMLGIPGLIFGPVILNLTIAVIPILTSTNEVSD